MTTRVSDPFCKAILDAYPSPVFVVDPEARIQELNRAARQLQGIDSAPWVDERFGNAAKCLNALQSPDGCGTSQACKECVIRQSVESALTCQGVHRRRAKMQMGEGLSACNYHFLVTTVPFDYEERALVLLVLEDFTELMELKQLIPICAQCKKIRGSADSWQKLESYFRSHWDVQFTHGLCPDCSRNFTDQMEQLRKT